MSALPGGRCHFEWDVYYELKWFVRPFEPVARIQFGRMFANAVESLKAYIRAQSRAA